MAKVIEFFIVFTLVTAEPAVDLLNSENNSTNDDSLDPKMPNSLQKLMFNLELSHLQPAPDIKFIVPLSPLQAKSGEKFTLKCTVMSSPPATFHWERNNELLRTDGTVNIHEKILNLGKEVIGTGQITSYFTVPFASESNGGTYKCVATNGHSTVESTAFVSVEGKAAKLPLSNDTVPAIIAITETRLQRIKNAATLHCRSNQPASFKWLFFKTPINLNNSRYEVLSTGDLIIKSITENDQGLYNCLVSNEYGRASAQSMLYTVP